MLDKNSETIKTMFNELAPKYDRMNTLISFCSHKIIKQKSSIGIGEAIATVNGEIVAKGELTFAVV